MKALITVLLLMIFTIELSGQVGDKCPRIQYTYDNVGNRTQRRYVVCFTGSDEDVLSLQAATKDNKALQNQQASKFSLKAYPNPNNGVFQVQIDNPQENAVLDLFDFTGRKITTQVVTTGSMPMTVNHLAGGSYMIIYRDTEKVLGQLKIIIE